MDIMEIINITEELEKTIKANSTMKDFHIGSSDIMPSFYSNGMTIMFDRFNLIDGKIYFYIDDIKTGYIWL